MTMTSSYADQEEYERAVSFLREFHSRRVASLHSSSLDAITESLDELASNFSMAVGVGSCESVSRKFHGDDSLHSLSQIAADPCNYVDQRRLNQSPRIKKAPTSKCLVDLDSSSSSEDNRVESPLPRSRDSTGRPPLGLFSGQGMRTVHSLEFMSSNCCAEEAEGDYYLGYCCESPMNKRHRNRCGIGRMF